MISCILKLLIFVLKSQVIFKLLAKLRIMKYRINYMIINDFLKRIDFNDGCEDIYSENDVKNILV